jgi:hypothetical protein
MKSYLLVSKFAFTQLVPLRGGGHHRVRHPIAELVCARQELGARAAAAGQRVAGHGAGGQQGGPRGEAPGEDRKQQNTRRPSPSLTNFIFLVVQFSLHARGT